MQIEHRPAFRIEIQPGTWHVALHRKHPRGQPIDRQPDDPATPHQGHDTEQRDHDPAARRTPSVASFSVCRERSPGKQGTGERDDETHPGHSDECGEPAERRLRLAERHPYPRETPVGGVRAQELLSHPGSSDHDRADSIALRPAAQGREAPDIECLGRGEPQPRHHAEEVGAGPAQRGDEERQPGHQTKAEPTTGTHGIRAECQHGECEGRQPPQVIARERQGQQHTGEHGSKHGSKHGTKQSTHHRERRHLPVLGSPRRISNTRRLRGISSIRHIRSIRRIGGISSIRRD